MCCVLEGRGSRGSELGGCCRSASSRRATLRFALRNCCSCVVINRSNRSACCLSSWSSWPRVLFSPPRPCSCLTWSCVFNSASVSSSSLRSRSCFCKLRVYSSRFVVNSAARRLLQSCASWISLFVRAMVSLYWSVSERIVSSSLRRLRCVALSCVCVFLPRFSFVSKRVRLDGLSSSVFRSLSVLLLRLFLEGRSVLAAYGKFDII